MALLEIRDLRFAYAANPEKSVLNGVSFNVEHGEFLVLCGQTGSGKSTLLRLLKRELRPEGVLTGNVLYGGKSIDELDSVKSACSIGYVCQRPEQQIVTDKVWHELAFGLENMGIPSDKIRSRVAEMAAYFGIEDWFDKRTDELSGGQKQLLNLASVMVMQPDVLLLDEPTAQLDPIAASEFISTVRKLSSELSLTVLIIEHRLEEVLPISDRVIALEDGKIITDAETRTAVEQLSRHRILSSALPAATRLHAILSSDLPCPISVREGRAFIERYAGESTKALKAETPHSSCETVLSFRDVYFRYGRNLNDVLCGLSFDVLEGEIFCLLGGNGSGKSTTLSAAAGLIKPYAGQISVFGRKLKEYKNQTLYRNCLSMLPQDVQTVFLSNTVREELKDVDIKELPYDISKLMDMHPYDLSGGQQQLVAFAKVLGTKPRLLLLDEPTKGLDAFARNEFTGILKQLKNEGVTVVCVTHDAEFAALTADRCALFFRGEIVSVSGTRAFFSGNSFYTTAAHRMSRGKFENAVTVEDLAELCRLNKRQSV